MTLLLLRLFASNLSSACSRFIQRFFLPSSLYLRSWGGLSSPSLHTPLSPLSTPSAMFPYLFSSYSDTAHLSFDSIPTLSPQSPGKALWVVWDSHPLFPPSGFVTSAATPVHSTFFSCSGYALFVSVEIKCAILHSFFLQCFSVNVLHVRSYPFSPSNPLHSVVGKFLPLPVCTCCIYTVQKTLCFNPASYPLS